MSYELNEWLMHRSRENIRVTEKRSMIVVKAQSLGFSPPHESCRILWSANTQVGFWVCKMTRHRQLASSSLLVNQRRRLLMAKLIIKWNG